MIKDTPVISASSALTISHSGPLPIHNSADFTMNASNTPNFTPATSWMPTTPSFPMSTGSSGNPGTPRHPGLVSSVQMITASAAVDSPSSAVPRPSAPVSLNPAVQQQMYPTYASLPSMASSPQGFWMQHPPMGGFPRPPFVPYTAFYPGPFPSASSGMPLPAPSSDSQPPGVIPLGTSTFAPSTATPANQSLVTSGIQTGLPLQGIDNRKLVHDIGTRVEAAVNEQSDVWTAHRTDTGVVYYYNALTGESTYEKPAGFKGEPDQVTMQPTPVSVEQLVGTDWALVTTNDGKKYYYNSKTKISSWQIPSEVAESRKKQDSDLSKENAVPVPNIDVVTEKGSTPISLSAPAVNTGGRDAMPLRTSVVPGSSSALDLIKKKLQDSGVPSSSPVPVMPVTAAQELNGSRAVDVKGLQGENSKDKLKDATGDGNISDSSSDSEDTDNGPSKEECVMQFKEMLKERGVAPFSKWEKELPKIVFDPRFKAIPSHSARRSLFEHYVKTRATEERREKRAAQKAAMEGFKQLLDEASEDIDHNTNYHTFKRKWGSDPRFEALDRKDRELLLTERVLLLKKAAEEKAQAIRAAAASSFKSMLKEKGDINVNSRWSRVKDSLRDDLRYKCVKHEDREVLFNEYISELKAIEEKAERKENVKKDEEEKLKERERELRKRKEREEQEMERMRLKVRRKEVVASFQALLVETIKDPRASWTESKPKLEKDPQGRAVNPDLDPSDMEKLFREHIKMLFERCANDFRALLAEVITQDAAAQQTEDGKTVLNSWSTAKRLLKPDPRYNKTPRKEREALWRRYAEDMLKDMLKKQKSALDQEEEKHSDAKARSSGDLGRFSSGSRKTHERR
ncbi:pre-mRNA-processing protein 40C isoform X2 [Durio zibethinus]|uniref:Pre-mRNA-processing protein 40C isoform X2 n=1 Tax=Durio zibethinus TaxID=66656 RepID=A0A6P6BHE9_DURZI|nr:pre-mRNA-processing protein 40C isoform X2 [Durio zibethinus]